MTTPADLRSWVDRERARLLADLAAEAATEPTLAPPSATAPVATLGPRFTVHMRWERERGGGGVQSTLGRANHSPLVRFEVLA